MKTDAHTSGPALLRDFLERHDTPVDQFARSVSVSRATLYRWLNGEGAPRGKQREAILDVTFGAVPPDVWIGPKEAAHGEALGVALHQRDERREARRLARDERRAEKRARNAHGTRVPDLGFELRLLPSPSRPIPFAPDALPMGARNIAKEGFLQRIAEGSLYRNARGEVSAVDPVERDMLLRRDAVFAAASSLALAPRPIEERSFTPPQDEKRALERYAPEFGRVVRYGSSCGPVWVTPEEAWQLAMRDSHPAQRRGAQVASAIDSQNRLDCPHG